MRNIPPDQKKESALKAIINRMHRMRRRHRFQPIRDSVRRTMNGWVHEEATSLKEKHDPRKFEELMIDRNREHFRQARGAPFTSEETIDALSFATDSQYVKDVL